MNVLIAVVILLLSACLLYYIPRLLIPPLRYVWGTLLLLAVSAGCCILVLNLINLDAFEYTFTNPFEAMQQLWDGALAAIQRLQGMLAEEDAVWTLYYLCAALGVNVFLGALAGIGICFGLEKEEHSCGFFGGIGVTVVAWPVLCIVELLLMMIFGIIEALFAFFTGDHVDTFAAIALVVLAIGVFIEFCRGGDDWEILWIRKK